MRSFFSRSILAFSFLLALSAARARSKSTAKYEDDLDSMIFSMGQFLKRIGLLDGLSEDDVERVSGEAFAGTDTDTKTKRVVHCTQISLGPLCDGTKAFTEIPSHARQGEFFSSDGQTQYEWAHRALASACHSMLCLEKTRWCLQTRQVGLLLGPFVGRVTPNDAIIFLEAACSGPIVCRAVDVESLHAVHLSVPNPLIFFSSP